MKPKVPHPLRDPASNLCDIIKYGYFHQLRLLVSTGIDLECRDSNRRTPIMLCAFMEPESWGIGIARNLIENNVRVDHRDKFGRNVFHYACIYERVGVIQVLLKAMDFDLNQADKLGNTALHYAAMSGNLVVTQIIARAFKRYKIDAAKTNKRGYTAVEEALRTGNSKCGHVIEQEMVEKRPGSAVKDVRFADEVVQEQNMMKGQRSAFNNLSTSHHHNNRPVSSRPWTASALVRRDSSLSSASLEDRLSSNSFRSRSNLSYGGGSYSARKPLKPLVAMGIRHDDDVIRCAEADDFRNKPDFVFKLVHLHYDPNEWHPVLSRDLTNHKTAWSEGMTNRSNGWRDGCSTSPSQQVISLGDWRYELKSLFKVYESQCSASWRAAQRAKTLSQEEQERLAAEMAEEDEKGKKHRRFSSNKAGSGGGNKEPAPELKRRMSTTRMRRRSSIHGLLAKMAAGPTSSSIDGSLNTSTESVNSLVTNNKRRGSDRELNPTLPSTRSENATARSGLRRPSTDSRHSLSPSPTFIVTDTTNNSNNTTNNSNKNNNSTTSTLKQPLRRSTFSSSANGGSENMKKLVQTAISVTSSEPAAHAQNGGGSTKKQEASPSSSASSRGRKASLITASLKSLTRKNDDAADAKIDNGTKKMTVPRVKESLVEDRKNSLALQSKPDTSRLWVQNPYADDTEDDDDDEYDEFDDNASEYSMC